jgi:hypothetical protein
MPEDQFEWKTIPLHEYNKMVKELQFLTALQNAGVDNWEGYDHAVEMLSDEDE